MKLSVGISICLLVGSLAALPGCIIGSWPTPEAKHEGDPASGTQKPDQLSTEPCDQLDNDADGVVDEGCPCSGSDRGCVGVVAGECGLGVQRCEHGVWQLCADMGPPWTPSRSPAIVIDSVSPTSLRKNGTEVVTVAVRPVPACPWMNAPAVRVSLRVIQPAMEVRAIAWDQGQAPDSAAGDGIYVGALGNPFGPGVPAQSVVVRASAVLMGTEHFGTTTLPLEEAP